MPTDRSTRATAAVALATTAMGLAGSTLAQDATEAAASGVFDAYLALAPMDQETLAVTMDGTELAVRRYEAVYVAQPSEVAATEGTGPMMGGGGGAPGGASGGEAGDEATAAEEAERMRAAADQPPRHAEADRLRA